MVEGSVPTRHTTLMVSYTAGAISRRAQVFSCEVAIGIRSEADVGSTIVSTVRTSCTIRNDFVKTFETEESLNRVPTHLRVTQGDQEAEVQFLISTQKVDEVVLLQVDEVVGMEAVAEA